MAISLQHACNRRFDTGPNLFKNDINNVAALQSARLQKKLMEEAAHLHQKQLEEAAENLQTQTTDKEKVQQERDELLRRMETLRRKKEDELVSWEKER